MITIKELQKEKDTVLYNVLVNGDLVHEKCTTMTPWKPLIK